MKQQNIFRVEKAILIFLISFLTLTTNYGQSSPIGWAAANGGTTGGQGGDVVTATSRNEFAAFCASEDPLIIKVEDTLELVLYERIFVNNNKTIIGTTTNAMLRYGGLEIKGNNVIVRNLIIRDSYDGDWDGKLHPCDAITIEGSNVWVDHCWLAASADGLLDVRSGSSTRIGDFVTVSYTKFSDHNKVSLIGSDDNSTQDRGHLRVTFHHCWFDGTVAKGLHQRLPRIRYGDIHLFNNYFEDISSYCILARIESDVVVENNYFRNAQNPHGLEDYGLGIKDPELIAFGNIYEFGSGNKLSDGTAFDPHNFYTYTADSASIIPALVMNEAGTFNKPGNKNPVAIQDDAFLESGDHSFEMDVLSNDSDPDGDDLRLAGIKNKPEGTILIRFNQLRYVGGFNPTKKDTVIYEVIDTEGGSTEGMLIVDFEGLTSSSKDFKVDDIKIYPNPAKEFLIVELPQDWNLDTTISISDLNGKKYSILSEKKASNKVKIKTNELAQGNYFITFSTDSKNLTKKFVIIR